MFTVSSNVVIVLILLLQISIAFYTILRVGASRDGVKSKLDKLEHDLITYHQTGTQFYSFFE